MHAFPFLCYLGDHMERSAFAWAQLSLASRQHFSFVRTSYTEHPSKSTALTWQQAADAVSKRFSEWVEQSNLLRDFVPGLHALCILCGVHWAHHQVGRVVILII